jgi:hypothetical protein
MRDKVGKGRNVVSGNAGIVGQANANSKLTEEQVVAIRESLLSQNKLAAKYGMSRRHIFRIKNRLSWSHVQ